MDKPTCSTCPYLYKDKFCHFNAELTLTCQNEITDATTFWCGNHPDFPISKWTPNITVDSVIADAIHTDPSIFIPTHICEPWINMPQVYESQLSDTSNTIFTQEDQA